MAECYVDFGATLMFVPILLLGYVLGWLYRAFAFSGQSRVWGTALAIATLFVTLQGFATTGSKLYGAVLTTGLVLFAIDRFFGRGIFKFLGGGRATGAQPQLR